MKEQEIREKIDAGFIHFNSIIEVLGKPVEHVEKTIKDYVKKLKENKKIIILNEEFSEPKKQEDLFSIFVDIEALVKNSEELVFFCFDYMPSSIEIVEPDNIKYKSREFSSFLNDLQARLHSVDMALKQYKSRNSLLIKNNSVLLRNMIVVILESGPKTKEEIAKRVGLPAEKIDDILRIMLEEKRIKIKSKKYELK